MIFHFLIMTRVTLKGPCPIFSLQVLHLPIDQPYEIITPPFKVIFSYPPILVYRLFYDPRSIVPIGDLSRAIGLHSTFIAIRPSVKRMLCTVYGFWFNGKNGNPFSHNIR